jgi:ParB-like chromosome segregation protein Spo0J
MHIPKTIIQIPIDKLLAHRENPNRMSKCAYEKLKRHIGESHNYEPLIVRRHPTIENSFEIINGHHRAQALRELGESFADCVEWEVDDDQARILLATLNRLGGKDRLDAKINLIKNLSEKFNSRELAKLLPDTKTVIEKLKSIEAQIKNSQYQIPDFKSEMPNSLVFFLDDEQMKIVEAAIEKAATRLRCASTRQAENTEDTEIKNTAATKARRYKETKAQKMADAITRIAEEWIKRSEK